MAPGQIAPGESTALVANGIRADGSIKDVTTEVRWTQRTGAETANLTLTSSGLTATATRPGSFFVVATLANLTAEAEVLVLPPGTFRLTGQVTDEGAPVREAEVSVISGTGQGLTAGTDGHGKYELYGLAGLVHIRVSKDGYFDKADRIDVRAHIAHAFEINQVAPTADYTGVYTLIVTSVQCTPGVPEFAKTRVYTARLEQSGASLVVDLSDANFWGSAGFAGVLEADGDLRFSIQPLVIWDVGGDFVERLSDGNDLIVGGVVVGRGTAAGITRKPVERADAAWVPFTRLNNPVDSCHVDRFEFIRR